MFRGGWGLFVGLCIAGLVHFGEKGEDGRGLFVGLCIARLRSAGRPEHRTSAQNVQMEVINRLPTVWIAVHHQPITLFCDARLGGDPPRNKDKMPDQKAVVFLDRIEGGDVLARDHQEVRRCGRMDISKRDAMLVFVHTIAGDLAS